MSVITAPKIARPSWYSKWMPPSDCVLWMPGLSDPQSSLLMDKSGNNNHGTITGATWRKYLKGYPTLEYDGVDDITTVADAVSIQNIFATGGSISGWIYVDSDGENNEGNIIQKGAASSKGYVLLVRDEAAGKVNLRFIRYYDDPGIKFWTTTATQVTIRQWTYYCLTYTDGFANHPTLYLGDSTSFRTLTNGAGLTVGGAAVGNPVSDAGENLTIGNRPATDRTFDGQMANTRMYNTLRTAVYCRDIFRYERSLFGV